MRVALQPGYVLHSRPYRDSSLLVELFTAEHGRLALVARGARGPRGRGRRAHGVALQPFAPLLVSFSGRGDLKTLGAAEAARPPLALAGKRLYSGLYLNELLMRLLHRHEAHPPLFAAYGEALSRLADSEAAEEALRRFELTLLDELGYRLNPGQDSVSGETVQADAWYRYEPDQGMVRIDLREPPPAGAYAGAELLAIAAGQLDGGVRGACKRLLREALAVHLGQQPLRSRELFITASGGQQPGE